MARKKRKKKVQEKKPPGRPRRNYEFEDAVQKVRNENLRSAGDYALWYEFHHPARFPKRPDRAYEKEWKGWGYFLGHYNEFPIKPKRFRKYEDAKAYARNLGFTSVEQWFDMCREGKLPEDIPARPDVYYQKSGEWYTWTEFLGTRIHHRVEYAQKSKKYFYIARYPDAPFQNIYAMGIGNSIYNLTKDEEFTILKIFEYEPDFDWISTVEKYSRKFTESGRSNEYFVDDPGGLMNEISLNLREVLDIR